MFRTPATFDRPRMFGPPRIFGGRAAASAGVKSEWCVSFAGAGSVSFTSQNLGTTHTIQAWLYHSGTTGVVVGGASGHRGLYVDATYLTYTAGGTSVSVAHGGIGNAWKHVAVVRSGTSVSFYLSGSQIGATQTLAANNALSVQYLGRDATGAYLAGRVDDVRIHSTALSGSSIAATADNTSPAAANVVYFPLDEGTGNTVDSVQSLTGTLASATWHPQTPPKLVSGRSVSARSLSFDGVDDLVDVDSIIALNSSTKATIAFWCKKLSSADDMSVGSRINATDGIWLQWYNNGKVYWNPRNGSMYSNEYALAFTSDWVHLCGVYDGSQSAASRLRMYINGVEVVTTLAGTPPASLSSTASNNWNLGGLSDGVFRSRGSIDDSRIFNRVASSTDVQRLARGQRPTVDDPVGWWKLDEGSGITAIDSGSGGNNGTLINGPTYLTDVPQWLAA